LKCTYDRHGGKQYWLATEMLNGTEAAAESYAQIAQEKGRIKYSVCQSRHCSRNALMGPDH
jgi:hypothetical protein